MQHLTRLAREHKLFAALLLAELAVLLYLAVGLVGAPATLTLSPGDFANEFTGIAAVDPEAGALQIYNDGSFQTDKEITFSTAGVPLRSGAYEVTVNYFSCQTPDVPTFSVLQSAGTLTFSSRQVPAAVQMDPLTLDDGHRTVSTRLWISAGARLKDLTATLTYEGGQLYLYSITLTEQPLYRLTRLVCFVLFFAVVNLLGWLFACGGIRRQTLRLPLALLAITVVACLPLCSDQLYFGHDLRYHLQRITAMAAELSYGQFPVRMATTTLNGYGYINPLCYCELFLTLPALLYNAWLPLRSCYQVYVFAVTLAATGFSYLCFARITASRRLGVLGAALYTLSVYRLVCVYFRAAVGEYTAMSFLPLVLLGVYEIYTCEKPRFAQWAPLAVGMTALVQCHLISTELTAAFLLLFCLVRLRQTLRPARLLAWGKAAVLAFGLSAWFLLPFVATTLSVDLQVNNPSVGKPQQEGLYLLQLLNPFGPGFGGTTVGTSTDMSLTLGLPLLVGLALVLYCLAHRRDGELPGALPVATGFGLLAALLTLRIFPWDFVESWLGSAVAKVAGTFQYPWRFLAFAVLLLTLATLLALTVLDRYRPGLVRPVTGLLAVCLVLSVGVFQTQLLTCDELSANTLSRDDCRDVGLGEYMINGCSIYETIWAQPKPGSDTLTLVSYEKRDGIAYMTLQNNGGETDISVPLFNYGHYTAVNEADGAPFAMTSGENARVVVKIPAGYAGTVVLAWHSPRWWRLCEVLSALCALGTVGFALWRRQHTGT